MTDPVVGYERSALANGAGASGPTRAAPDACSAAPATTAYAVISSQEDTNLRTELDARGHGLSRVRTHKGIPLTVVL